MAASKADAPVEAREFREKRHQLCAILGRTNAENLPRLIRKSAAIGVDCGQKKREASDGNDDQALHGQIRYVISQGQK